MLTIPKVVIEIARAERMGVGGKKTAVLPRYFDVVALEDGGTTHVSLRYVGHTHYAQAHAERVAEEITSSAAAPEIMARFLENALVLAVRAGEIKRVTFYAPPSSVHEREILRYTPNTATLDVPPELLPAGTTALAEFRAADSKHAHAFLASALREINLGTLCLMPCAEGVEVRIIARPARPAMLENAKAFVRTFQTGAQFQIGADVWRVTALNANLARPEATLVPVQ